MSSNGAHKAERGLEHYSIIRQVMQNANNEPCILMEKVREKTSPYAQGATILKLLTMNDLAINHHQARKMVDSLQLVSK